MRYTIFSLLIAVVYGCGPSPRATSATTSNASATTSKPGAPPASTKPSVESQRASFMVDCMKEFNHQAYCDCSFAQYSEVFRDADLTKEVPAVDDPRMQQLARRILQACSDSYPEEKSKEAFLRNCDDGDARLDPYCECAWAELRKSLSVAELSTHEMVGTAKWAGAERLMSKACKGKFPAEIAADQFVARCKQDPQKTEKYCLCRWKKLIAKYSIEELIAGTVDTSQVPDLNKCK